MEKSNQVILRTLYGREASAFPPRKGEGGEV